MLNIRYQMALGIAAVLILVGAPDYAFAYVGPGAGITAIGTVIALIGAVLLAIVGFLWYPVKRMLNKRGKGKQSGQG